MKRLEQYTPEQFNRFRDLFLGGLLGALTDRPSLRLSSYLPSRYGQLIYDYRTVSLADCNPKLSIIPRSRDRFITSITPNESGFTNCGYSMLDVITLLQKHGDLISLDDFAVLLQQASFGSVDGKMTPRKNVYKNLEKTVNESSTIPEDKKPDFLAAIAAEEARRIQR